MRKKPSTAQRIRSMIDRGCNNKTIIEKLKCKPQAVYNIRYQLNKERGLGSIGKLPKPVDGIGAPPRKRKGTGIMDAPKPLAFPEPYANITMFEPEPTLSLWERVKRVFRG